MRFKFLTRCPCRLLFSRHFFFKHLLVLFNFLGSDKFAITLNDIRLYIVGTMNCPTSCTESVKSSILKESEVRDLTIIIILLFYSAASLLTPWCRVLLQKLTGLQLVKNFPAFHGTRRFITALTSVRHLSLSWASPIQSIYPHPTSWRSVLILSTHQRLGLPSGLFPSGFPTKTLYTALSSPILTYSMVLSPS